MSTNTHARILSMLLCALFAALCAAGAFLQVPLAFLPVTLQTFFSTLSGLVLGPKRGGLAVLVYLFLGLVGLPIFSAGGGLGYVVHPSFGFLLALYPATMLSGWLFWRSKKRTFAAALCASLAGMAVIYAIGLPYFYMIQILYLQHSFSVFQLISLCFFPFLPGDLLKALLCGLLAPKVIKFLPAALHNPRFDGNTNH